MWQVDAPKAPPIVAIERLEYDPASHSPRDPSLNDNQGTLVQYGTPDGTCHRRLGIAVLAIGMTAESQPLCPKFRCDIAQYDVELRPFGAGPRCAQPVVEARLPVRILLVRNAVIAAH